MRKILYIFAVLSFFATATCYAQMDGCLKLWFTPGDTTWTNPDSVMVDSCELSLGFGKKYAKGSFQIGFSYYLLPTPDGAEDTIIDRTWRDIDTQYVSVRNAFDTLEQHYGSYYFRRDDPHINDTSLGRKSRFFVWFDDYVPIDSVTTFIEGINHVEYAVYLMRAGRVLTSINKRIYNHNNLSIHPNPANNYFTLMPSDKTISGQVSVRIFDERGVVVASESIDISSENKINTSSLASGVYQVYCDDAKVGSLVVQR